MVTEAVYSVCLAVFLSGLVLLRHGGIHRLPDRRQGMQRKLEDLRVQLRRRAAENLFHKRRRQAAAERGIYEAIVWMRNLVVMGRGGSFSSDGLISELSAKKSALTPAYTKLLTLLRLNRRKEAAEAFAAEAACASAEEFASLLVQWDEIDPAELMEVLLSHQKNIRETRITAQKKQDEVISDLIYLPVVLNVIVLFINFIYVGFYLEQQELLQAIL